MPQVLQRRVSGRARVRRSVDSESRRRALGVDLDLGLGCCWLGALGNSDLSWGRGRSRGYVASAPEVLAGEVGK